MFLIAAPATAAPVTIAVEAARDSRVRLEQTLRLEIGEVVFEDGADVDLVVSIGRIADTFRVRVEGRDAVLAERRVPTTDGLPQAERVAVLLTTRAVDTLRELAAPFELPPPPRTYQGYASAGVVASMWRRPRQPQLGAQLGFGLAFRTLAVGLAVGASGHVCCRRSSSGITGDAHEYVLAVEGAWTFVRWGAIFARVRGAAGLNWVRAEAEPQTFADTAPTQSVAATEGLLRGGLSLAVEPIRDRLTFAVTAGVWGRIGGAQVSVPTGYSGEGWSSGAVTPWIDLRLEALVF